MNRRIVTIPVCKFISKTFSDEAVARIAYRSKFKKSLNLSNPQTFNEKIIWLKLNWCPNEPNVVKCADKYLVREYLVKRGYGRYLNELLQVWDSPDEIDWNNLPKSFAMKCNHGMGYNIICPDIKDLDIESSKKKISQWFAEDFGYETSEPHYRSIKKRIILERYIDSLGSKLPTDWQFFCFNGSVKMILVRVPSGSEPQNYEHYIFDKNWSPLDFINGESVKEIDKPDCINELIEATEELGKQFPFLRLDFYIENDQPMFGEMTFTSSSGYSTTFTDEAQVEIGSWLTLPRFEKE